MPADNSPRRPAARLLAALLLCAAAACAAAAAPGEAELQRFIATVRDDPAALESGRALLERMTPAQLAQAIEGSGNTHFTWLYPMVLKAEDYPALAGLPVAQASLWAVRGNRLVPIPFQVDEFDRTGLAYIAGSEAAQRQRIDGEPGRWDRSDELVFMYRDAGLRRATGAELAALPAPVVATLELRHDGLPPRWVHVTRGTAVRSGADYVRADLARNRVQTTLADIEWSPGSMAQLRRVAPRVGPARGRDILDTMYGEVSTGLLQKDLRVGLNTAQNIRVQPVAVKDGPVRALLLVRIRVNYAGLPVYTQHMNVAIYEQGANLPSRFSPDSLGALRLLANFLREPRLEFSMDFAGIPGAQVQFESTQASGPGTVDGRIDEAERAMNAVRLPGDWLWLDSRQGWGFFFSNNMPVVRGGYFDAFLEGMETRVFYEDDPRALREGERIPGAGPRIGISAQGMPLIAINMLSSLRDVDFGKVDSIGTLLLQMIELDRQGRLGRLNRNIQLVHERMLREGRIRDTTDLARLFIADFERIGLRGTDMNRAQVNEVFFLAVRDATSLTDYRLGPVLEHARRLAAERGLDLGTLRYAMRDNTLWFPDSAGPGGPAAFHREASSPPRAVLVP